MGKQRLSDKRTSSSKYPADLKEGIFVRKAQYENPLTPDKRNSIIRKSQKPQVKKLRFNPETQEIGNSPSWEDKLDEKWANLYILATVAENANP